MHGLALQARGPAEAQTFILRKNFVYFCEPHQESHAS